MTDRATLRAAIAAVVPTGAGWQSIREIVENRQRELEVLIADYDIAPAAADKLRRLLSEVRQ